MSSAAEALRAQAARATARPSTKSEAGRAESRSRQGSQTVKLTVRLSKPLNQDLKQLLLEAADKYDVARVSAQQVTEALYEELLKDDRLRERVLRRVHGLI